MALNKRLLHAASFVPKGSRVADIGCDHAYLPIYLIKENIAKEVIACDINRGPIEKAEENISREGLGTVIKTLQTDGLVGLEAFMPDTVVICGMGGDLIFRIINDSDYTRQSAPLLILQPMTKQAELRRSLLSAGYNIINESLVYDDRLYEIIIAKYDGVKRSWSQKELLCGKYNKTSQLYALLIERLINQYTVVIDGKKRAGLDTDLENELLQELKNENYRAL